MMADFSLCLINTMIFSSVETRGIKSSVKKLVDETWFHVRNGVLSVHTEGVYVIPSRGNKFADCPFHTKNTTVHAGIAPEWVRGK